MHNIPWLWNFLFSEYLLHSQQIIQLRTHSVALDELKQKLDELKGGDTLPILTQGYSGAVGSSLNGKPATVSLYTGNITPSGPGKYYKVEWAKGTKVSDLVRRDPQVADSAESKPYFIYKKEQLLQHLSKHLFCCSSKFVIHNSSGRCKDAHAKFVEFNRLTEELQSPDIVLFFFAARKHHTKQMYLLKPKLLIFFVKISFYHGF